MQEYEYDKGDEYISMQDYNDDTTDLLQLAKEEAEEKYPMFIDEDYFKIACERIKKCTGKYVFQKEIHNGNDAYKCNECGDVLVTKILNNSSCEK